MVQLQADCWRIDALNCGAGEDSISPLDNEKIKPVNRKENQPWIFIGRTNAEAPRLWPSDVKSQFIEKDPDAGKDWGQEEKGATEDEMVGWHHWLNGHGFEQILGDDDRLGSLACCSLISIQKFSMGSQRVTDDWVTELIYSNAILQNNLFYLRIQSRLPI